MTAATLTPWLENVQLHPDVLSDAFSEDIFALDLGPLADCLLAESLHLPTKDLPTVPVVYREPEHFFRASYLTSGLCVSCSLMHSTVSEEALATVS